MKNKLSPYLAFTRAGLKTELAYKAQAVMWIIIDMLEVLMIIFLYGAIYRSSDGGASAVIGGFTYNEIIVYMITSFFFSFVLAGDTAYNIYTDVREGTVVNTLTKPVSYRLKHLFTFFGSQTFTFCLILLPFLTVCYTVFFATGMLSGSVTKVVLRVLTFLVFAALAGLIHDAIGYFTGMMVFYTDHLFGLNMVRNTLQGFLGGRFLPLSFMGAVGVAFSYTPFAFLNSVPVLVLMGKLGGTDVLLYLAIAVGWLALIELANHCIFARAMRRLTVQGG